MLKSTYYMRQIADPVAFLDKYAALTRIGKRRMYQKVRRHERHNDGQPFVADLKSGLLIAETPFEINALACWLSERDL